MSRIFISTLTVICLVFNNVVFTQNNTNLSKEKSFLGIGAGISRSVVFLSRNIKEFNDASGLYITAVYERPKKLIRHEASFIQYQKIQIYPTWIDVSSWIVEYNIHFLAHFKKSDALLFPAFGLCLSRFEGFFTGISDVQNLRSVYKPNSKVIQYWTGLTFGVGAEKKFMPFSVGGFYKMRISNGDIVDKINIIDVCYQFFVKYYFPLRVRKKYLGPRGRYFLKTKESTS